jgi:ribosomal protein L12E/L44/L45/RPP1/RPP2
MSSKSLMEIYEEAAPHIAYLQEIKEIVKKLEGKSWEEVIEELREREKRANPTLQTDIKILLKYIEKR